MMGETLDNNDLNVNVNMEAIKKSNNRIKSHKCSQCNYASSQKGNLKTHLKTHSGEKSNKCSQCDFASSHAYVLRQHLKTHSGEMISQRNATDVNLHPLKQVI